MNILKNHTVNLRLACAAAALCASFGVSAVDTLASGDLTPSGAERAGNKDGSIPAWPGNEVQQTGWSFGKYRGDFWKYKGETALFSIDAGNVDKYADKLSPGQVAVIKQIKGYRMDVYPTRRTCGVPEFVAENTRKNAAGAASMAADGWSLKEAILPGYPFPKPKNGEEAMWNNKMRYHGVNIDFKNTTTNVSPRKGSDQWISAAQMESIFYPWGKKGSTPLSSLPPVEYQIYFSFTEPAAIAGQAFVGTMYVNQPGVEGFYYFAGQRRVRRVPSYAYDAPQIGFENQYTVDESYVFNGTIDRFDWKIVGKKELYVPYNVFGAYDFKAKLADVRGPDFLEPKHRRYELHRVWVLEATVKKGMRHLAPKRTFYLDEDSWNLMVADDYDAEGKLAKVREGLLIPVYETGTCDVIPHVEYNLNEGRYVLDNHGIGTGVDTAWHVDAKGPMTQASFYTSDNLRAISER